MDEMKKPLMTFLFDYFKPLYIDVFWFQKKTTQNSHIQPWDSVYIYIIYNIIYSNKKP